MTKRRQRQPTTNGLERDGAANDPTPEQIYQAALKYIKSGLSLIPIQADGSKRPAWNLLPSIWCETECRHRHPWGGYRERPPTRAELRDWFQATGDAYGMAILCGKVSGNLEIVDLDNWGVVEPWMRLVEQRAPGLLQRLVRVKTPRPGMHVYYRCEIIGGNQKLARVPDPEKDNLKPKTIIEVKGEGGYCLAPPSPAACHKSGRCYVFFDDKDLTQLPTITIEERNILLECARALNCWEDPRKPEYVRRQPKPHGRFSRPGDEFNAHADWADILKPHGWKWSGRGGDGSDHWCRPGKARGTSATSNFAGSELLFVFSSNADPFDDGTAYSKFHAFTLLNHHGDFRAAARDLRNRGYGVSRSRQRRVSTGFERYAAYPVRARRSTP